VRCVKAGFGLRQPRGDLRGDLRGDKNGEKCNNKCAKTGKLSSFLYSYNFGNHFGHTFGSIQAVLAEMEAFQNLYDMYGVNIDDLETPIDKQFKIGLTCGSIKYDQLSWPIDRLLDLQNSYNFNNQFWLTCRLIK
jgi:hypothetical protein